MKFIVTLLITFLFVEKVYSKFSSIPKPNIWLKLLFDLIINIIIISDYIFPPIVYSYTIYKLSSFVHFSLYKQIK